VVLFTFTHRVLVQPIKSVPGLAKESRWEVIHVLLITSKARRDICADTHVHASVELCFVAEPKFCFPGECLRTPHEDGKRTSCGVLARSGLQST
jgi:hypothetical protein